LETRKQVFQLSDSISLPRHFENDVDGCSSSSAPLASIPGSLRFGRN